MPAPHPGVMVLADARYLAAGDGANILPEIGLNLTHDTAALYATGNKTGRSVPVLACKLGKKGPIPTSVSLGESP